MDRANWHDFYHARAHHTPYYFWLGEGAEEAWYDECREDEAEHLARQLQRGALV